MIISKITITQQQSAQEITNRSDYEYSESPEFNRDKKPIIDNSLKDPDYEMTVMTQNYIHDKDKAQNEDILENRGSFIFICYLIEIHKFLFISFSVQY